MVWDADALNLLSENPDLLKKLPEGTPVSYTHLDVYKRQLLGLRRWSTVPWNN